LPNIIDEDIQLPMNVSSKKRVSPKMKKHNRKKVSRTQLAKPTVDNTIDGQFYNPWQTTFPIQFYNPYQVPFYNPYQVPFYNPYQVPFYNPYQVPVQIPVQVPIGMTDNKYALEHSIFPEQNEFTLKKGNPDKPKSSKKYKKKNSIPKKEIKTPVQFAALSPLQFIDESPNQFEMLRTMPSFDFKSIDEIMDCSTESQPFKLNDNDDDQGGRSLLAYSLNGNNEGSQSNETSSEEQLNTILNMMISLRLVK